MPDRELLQHKGPQTAAQVFCAQAWHSTSKDSIRAERPCGQARVTSTDLQMSMTTWALIQYTGKSESLNWKLYLRHNLSPFIRHVNKSMYKSGNIHVPCQITHFNFWFRHCGHLKSPAKRKNIQWFKSTKRDRNKIGLKLEPGTNALVFINWSFQI